MRAAARVCVFASVVGCALSLARGPAAGAAKWDPIDPQELAETTPVVQKDADAEALAWDISIADDASFGHLSAVYSHYLRVKIFTDRGRETFSRVDIPMAFGGSVDRVEARSIRRDGTFTEVKKEDVYERTLVKAGGLKVKATSFALPAVETGGIVEYRWRENYENRLSQNLRLPLSRDIPVRLVRYHIAPIDLNVIDFGMRARPFHANASFAADREKEDRTVVSMRNVPADSDEPHAPSAWETRPWVLIYYGSQLSPKEPAKFWLEYGKKLDSNWKKSTEPTSEIKQAASSLALSTGSLDEKIAALVAFCRAKVRRVDVDTATASDRKDFDFNKSPAAALAAGRGNGSDVIGLFVALARAAGLEARVAELPSRNDVTFNGSWMLTQLMTDVVVAVRDGDRWRFVDPANDHAPAGHLAWSQEQVPALIADDKTLVGVATPAAPPEFSLESRTATLRLSEDGTLEGDVTVEYSGHLAMTAREREDHLAPAERETALKERLAGRIPGIEVTAVGIDNVAVPDKPYVNRYHVKAAGYAQRTGSRLFIQPALFQKGSPAEFPAAQRRNPIFLEHAWKEIDRVRIALPPGYSLESPEAPAPVALAPVGGYSMALATTADGRWVEMRREFFFGGQTRLLFPAEAYAALKQFFDAVAKSDGHTLTLRKSAGAGGRPH